MANNYHQVTMEPCTLKLSTRQEIHLSALGAAIETATKGSYVFWEESFEDEVTSPCVLEDAVRAGDITDDTASLIKKTTFVDLCRQILEGNPEVSVLTVSGAITCSKMRPGEFGGTQIVVTRKQSLSFNTWDWQINEDGSILTNIGSENHINQLQGEGA